MDEIKLLALDLDGTLTNSNKKISSRNKQYIHKAREFGVSIVLASGRPLIGIKSVADTLDLWKKGGYILAYNGGQIIDCCTKKDLVKCTIDPQYYLDICKINKSFDVFPLTYDDNGIICENNTNQYVQREAYNNGIGINKVKSLKNAIKKPVVKFMVVGEPTELKKVYVYLRKEFDRRLNIFFSEPYFLEITPMGIEKASALEKLVEYLGYTNRNVMACGDGLNDIPMLQYAGLAVAMENAYDETKANADYISRSNEDDGVAFAISKFILTAN